MPNNNKKYFIRDNKDVEKMTYYGEGKGLDIYFNHNVDYEILNSYENVVSSIKFNYLKKMYSVQFNTDIEKRNKHKTLFSKEYYLNQNIEKTIYETDSLVNNDIDSLPCHYLIHKYYKNGQLEFVGCGTNEYGYASETPLGVYKYYDSLGLLKKTIFYHIHKKPLKGYKLITQYDNNGKILSKVKTSNDYLDDIYADTLKIYK